jgi:hypothetical protein
MIFRSYNTYKVGTIIRSRFWTDKKDGIKDEQPFFIIREATRKEWEDFVLSTGIAVDKDNLPNAKFYEVSTD